MRAAHELSPSVGRIGTSARVEIETVQCSNHEYIGIKTARDVRGRGIGKDETSIAVGVGMKTGSERIGRTGGIVEATDHRCIGPISDVVFAPADGALVATRGIVVAASH